MRILVLAQNIGITSSGIVFERILYELLKRKDVELDIVVSNYCSSTLLKEAKVRVVKYPKIHPRINKLIIGFAGTDIISHFLKRRMRFDNNDYDIILSLVSSGNYFGLIAGLYLKKRLNVKWGCYFVDAIPAPNGWIPNDLYFRSVRRMVSRVLRSVDYLASVSKEMLVYQMSLFERKDNLLTDVLYPPTETTRIVHYEANGDNRCFLYTGSLYGLRKAKYIIEAFSAFCEEVNNIDLIFVGDCHHVVDAEKKKYNDEISKRIVVKPYTSNLIPYYKNSIALIDIDADVENDVFLSGKIGSYLAIDRPIICETGLNSPSRHIFAGLSSIIQCEHNPTSLKKAMNYVIDNQDKFDYSERNHVLKDFSAGSVAQKLFNGLRHCLQQNDYITAPLETECEV